MLATLLIWILIFYLANSFGMIGIELLGRLSGLKKPLLDSSLWIHLVVGLGFLSLIACICSLFVAISYKLLIAIFIVSLTNIRKNVKYLQSKARHLSEISEPKDWTWYGAMFSFFLLLLIQAIKEPFVTDTGLYHAQTIQWAEKYKVVKGLGNLHGRLAFNSGFHLLGALFSFRFLVSATLNNTVQSFLLLCFGFSLINKIKIEVNPSIRFVYAGTLLLLIVFYRDWVSSPSPDIPTTIYLLSAFFLFKNIKKQSRTSLIDYYILLFISLVVITFKVSAIPILLLPLISLINTQRNHGLMNIFCASSLLSLLVITPWLVRNIMLSGYLLYPFPAIDLFDFYWKIPLEYAIRENQWIQVFARTGSYDIKTYSNLSYFEWFIPWFLKKTFVEKVIFITLCFSPLIIFSKQLKQRIDESNFATVLVVSCTGVIFWFTTAPYFRFGHGFIIVTFLLTIVYFFNRFIIQIEKLVKVVLMMFIVYSIPKEISEFSGPFHSLIVYPQTYPHVNCMTHDIEDKKIYQPVDGVLCWDHYLPCTPEILPGLKFAGERIDDGFYIDRSSLTTGQQ